MISPRFCGKLTANMRITFAIRLEIYERDNYTCVYCKTKMNRFSDKLCLDHSNPAGPTDKTNLVTSCIKCNTRKGILTAEAFLAKKQPPPPIAIRYLEDLLRSTCRKNNTSLNSIRSGRRLKHLVNVRRKFAWEARKRRATFTEIGYILRMHHTSILHLLTKKPY